MLKGRCVLAKKPVCGPLEWRSVDGWTCHEKCPAKHLGFRSEKGLDCISGTPQDCGKHWGDAEYNKKDGVCVCEDGATWE